MYKFLFLFFFFKFYVKNRFRIIIIINKIFFPFFFLHEKEILFILMKFDEPNLVNQTSITSTTSNSLYLINQQMAQEIDAIS
jgi:hypothetical protein